MKRLIAASLVAAMAVVALGNSALAEEAKFADDEQTSTWEGMWNNKKFNTTGPLKCVATVKDDGTWEGTFTGTFQGDPFEYQATFQSKQQGRVTNLAGNAKIRGHDYEWIGQIRGNVLAAKYKSSVGYYGEFVLKAVK